MNKIAKLLKTNSYFNVLNVLQHQLEKTGNNINEKSIIFCEEKVSLSVENVLCGVKKGSFSTFVYSFSKYLKKYYKGGKVLSKEGSTMAIKRLLKSLPLKCFNRSRNGISASIYNLIVQLKSAKVKPQDIDYAVKNSSGLLKNKLEDIYLIYSAYEDFITKGGYDDQSSLLTYLPKIISNDEQIKDTDVYLVGYTSWTRQALAIVKALLENAKSVTLIVNGGENKNLYLNEVENLFNSLCDKLNIEVDRQEFLSPLNNESEIILGNLFSPKSFGVSKYSSEKIYSISAYSSVEEVQKTAEIIKKSVIESNAKYSHFTIAIGNNENLKNIIRRTFEKLDIPYYLDQKIKGENTALVSLILDYIEVHKKNFERGAVCRFFKNPLFNLSKNFSDELENYVIRYNVNYSRFKTPFTLAVKGENIAEFNKVREQLVDIFSTFSIRDMLEKLDVESRQESINQKLIEYGYFGEQAVNSQIYDYVDTLLGEMELLLGSDANVNEIKETFISGVKALELSIIPQFKDAVFVGGHKECAVYQNKVVFALELNSDVPNVKEDVAILSDSDLVMLENIKLLIEPKIRVVNHREREALAMALSCFTDRLYLCCPSVSGSGKKNVKSEVFTYFEKLFTIKNYNKTSSYLTQKQGLESFSKDCTMFVDGRITEFSNASNFYYATKQNEQVERILNVANSEIEKAIYIDRTLAKEVTSPTKLENYSSCPYKSFIENYLRVTDREQGVVNSLSTGNIIHEIFEKYVKQIDKVFDRESSDNLCESLMNEILLREEYQTFLSDEKENATIKRVRVEAKEFCFKIFESIKNSSFKPLYLEQKFGFNDKESLPPIRLLGGKVKLKGKIDRVDKFKNYIRIIDYKTGKVNKSKSNLFVGSKLQLYLYGKVFDQIDSKDSDGEKDNVAGVYYMPISNAFDSQKNKEEKALFSGDSIDNEEIINAQDNNYDAQKKSNLIGVVESKDKIKGCVSQNEMSAFTEYAVKEAEIIAQNMTDGFIPASPLENTCSYCKFLGICNERRCHERKVLKVDEETIVNAVKGDKD